MKKFLSDFTGAFGVTVLLLAGLATSSAYGSSSPVNNDCVRASGGCPLDVDGTGCSSIQSQLEGKCVLVVNAKTIAEVSVDRLTPR